MRSRTKHVLPVCADSFDGFADAGDLAAGGTAHHDDVALAQDRDDELRRRGDLSNTQRSDEGRRVFQCPHGTAQTGR